MVAMISHPQIILQAALLLSCFLSDLPVSAAPTSRPADEAQIVEAANGFALALYKGAVHDNENLVISPYCTFISLAILREGAAGETAEAMRKLLGLSGKADADRNLLSGMNHFITGRNATEKNLICETANAFWFQQGVDPANSFLANIRAGFAAEVKHGDFGGTGEALSKEINAWVNQQTHGKIKDLCTPDLLKGIRSTLISAIYFHGHWIHPFQEERTRDADFRPTATRRVTVKMMHREAVGDYYHGDGVQLTAIPYYTNEPNEGVADCQFVLIMPDDPLGLANLEKTIDLPTLNRWIRSSRPTEKQMEAAYKRQPAPDADENEMKAWKRDWPLKEVRLDLPRFSIQTRLLLGSAMNAAGAAMVFDPAADFSRMGKGVFMANDVLQAARIDVDEKGTEAAAAQEYGLFGGSSGSPVTLTVDHPFMYLIRESTTGAILFVGRVCDPSK